MQNDNPAPVVPDVPPAPDPHRNLYAALNAFFAVGSFICVYSILISWSEMSETGNDLGGGLFLGLFVFPIVTVVVGTLLAVGYSKLLKKFGIIAAAAAFLPLVGVTGLLAAMVNHQNDVKNQTSIENQTLDFNAYAVSTPEGYRQTNWRVGKSATWRPGQQSVKLAEKTYENLSQPQLLFSLLEYSGNPKHNPPASCDYNPSLTAQEDSYPSCQQVATMPSGEPIWLYNRVLAEVERDYLLTQVQGTTIVLERRRDNPDFDTPKYIEMLQKMDAIPDKK